MAEAFTAAIAGTDLDRLDAVAPPGPAFPHGLIASSCLRCFAVGDPEPRIQPRRVGFLWPDLPTVLWGVLRRRRRGPHGADADATVALRRA